MAANKWARASPELLQALRADRFYLDQIRPGRRENIPTFYAAFDVLSAIFPDWVPVLGDNLSPWVGVPVRVLIMLEVLLATLAELERVPPTVPIESAMGALGRHHAGTAMVTVRWRLVTQWPQFLEDVKGVILDAFECASSLPFNPLMSKLYTIVRYLPKPDDAKHDLLQDTLLWYQTIVELKQVVEYNDHYHRPDIRILLHENEKRVAIIERVTDAIPVNEIADLVGEYVVPRGPYQAAWYYDMKRHAVASYTDTRLTIDEFLALSASRKRDRCDDNADPPPRSREAPGGGFGSLRDDDDDDANGPGPSSPSYSQGSPSYSPMDN